VELSAGWTQVRLGEILLAIEAGRSFTCEPRRATRDEWGIIKVSAMTWGKFDAQENKAVPAGRSIDPRYEIRPGDILVSRANTEAYVGAPVLVGQCRPHLLLSDKSLRLIPGSGIDRQWLVYALASPTVRRQISAKSTGAQESMRNISQATLAEISIFLPPPAEQRRIVEVLEDHLSRLDAANRLALSSQAQHAVLRRALLNQLRKSAIERGGKLAQLGTVAETMLGKMLDAQKNTGEPTPYLRNINVRWGWFNLNEIDTVPMSIEQQTKFSLLAGDILACEGGEPGRCAIWSGTPKIMAFQKALHRIRPSDSIDSRWIALMLEEAVINGRVRNMLTGTTIKHFPQEKLRILEIPIPDLNIQIDLVKGFEESVTQTARLAQSTNRVLRRADHLRGALLTQALSGRLVPQDAADEPASKLLARIQAERLSQPKAKRTRRVAAKSAVPPQKTSIVPVGIQEELPL
jgi:type I restriction enzyme, S subunit